MKKPEWVEKHKEPKTEIKYIKGHYYKYRVEYKYNKLSKRTDKITKELLGKITEANGFVVSEKKELRSLSNVDIKRYGDFHLFYSLLGEDVETLLNLFDEQTSKTLLIVAFMRWSYQAPIKRMPELYLQNYSSEKLPINNISAKSISQCLKSIGEQRVKVVDWMRERTKGINSEKGFVIIDGTHIPSLSENLQINCQGYNSQNSYDPQVNLIYVYSTELKQPIYYRLVNGNIVDLKSMKSCIVELGLEKVVFVADKGFYSTENIILLAEHGLKYIIPLKRNSSLVNFSELEEIDFKKQHNYFLYKGRIIWHYEYEQLGSRITTFLDDKLKIQEETDYLKRIETHPEKYSREKFNSKLNSFGTLSIINNLDNSTSPKELYEIYKERNEIEVMFGAYKGFLEADKTYMQNQWVMEGWLMANFIAMMVYYTLVQKLKTAKLRNNHSPKDIIEYAKCISALKMNNQWKVSETTKKVNTIFNQIEIDYLTLQS